MFPNRHLPAPTLQEYCWERLLLAYTPHASSAFDFSRNLVQKLLLYAAPLGITVPPQTAADPTVEEAEGKPHVPRVLPAPTAAFPPVKVQAHTYSSSQPRKYKLYLWKTAKTWALALAAGYAMPWAPIHLHGLHTSKKCQ